MESEPLNIVDKDSYLLVEFFGEFSVAAGKRCVDRMVEACEKHGRSRVLLDCRKMTGNLPVFERFKVAVYGAEHQQHQRLALLRRADVTPSDQFVQNVAVNRGMDLKIFTDFDEAEQWLTRSTSSSGNPAPSDGE